MIKFDRVSFRYRDDSSKVINDINLSIDRGEWVALIGHNGSGKSTVAKMMNGLLLPSEGQVFIDDIELTEQNLIEVRQKVGMVFQNPENQFVGTTVLDDVAFGLENLGVDPEYMYERIQQSLKQVSMDGYEQHEPHRLSGGQKQRIAIAGVLAMLPEVIVFDEATTMLDPMGRKDLLQTMKTLKEERGLSIVSITHDLTEAAFADRVLVLNQGEVWFEGEPRQLFAKGEELENIGLEPPFVTKLYHQLKSENITLEREPLDFKELVDELWTLHLKK
ncbi:energy-coupling factor transporter ATPase [Alkalibacillus aidingensis]|uniref:energy-coupling factor transporter ATPase n=1 Tax=Alkalibacillus aidingensis TaxID=2747607 RepID=UPI001CB7174E|nr:energy-coupling factor transporter ATPase [Alkalibacillus aidingensis]